MDSLPLDRRGVLSVFIWVRERDLIEIKFNSIFICMALTPRYSLKGLNGPYIYALPPPTPLKDV